MEIEHTGLEKFLKGKPRVTKAELQDFIKQNKIKLDETNLGGTSNAYVDKLKDDREGLNEQIYAIRQQMDWSDAVHYKPEELAKQVKEGSISAKDAELAAKWNELNAKQGDLNSRIHMALDDREALQADSQMTWDTLNQYRRYGEIRTNDIGSEVQQIKDMRAKYGYSDDQIEYYLNKGDAERKNAPSKNPELSKALEEWFDADAPESLDKLRNNPAVPPEVAKLAESYDQMKDVLDNSNFAKPTKYEKWTLPGEKSNYTERLITLPKDTANNAKIEALTKEIDGITEQRDAIRDTQRQLRSEMWDHENDPVGSEAELRKNGALTKDETFEDHKAKVAQHLDDLGDKYKKLLETSSAKVDELRSLAKDDYTSSHFDEKNILAHTRFDERPLEGGGNTLFLEEVQSDWHQAGKNEGYRNPQRTEELRQQLIQSGEELSKKSLEYKAAHDAWSADNADAAKETAKDKALFELRQATQKQTSISDEFKKYATGGDKVPDAPFKTDWHELVMKRMLREAAEKNHDSLSWTTGAQQAERYDLSKHIGKVSYDPESSNLVAYDPSGHQVIDERVEPDELHNYVGKEVADKLRDQAENYSGQPDEQAIYDGYADMFQVVEDEATAEDVSNGLAEEEGETVYVVKRDGEDIDRFSSERKAERHVNEEINYYVQEEVNNGDWRGDMPEVSGLDLKTGGEWAAALYDRAIPNFMNKYLKKFGVRVETTKLKPDMPEGSLRYEVHDESGNVYDAFRTEAQADDAAANHRGYKVVDKATPTEVHTIKITPEMKKFLMKEGQPIAKNDNDKNDKLREVMKGAEGVLA